jgi:hypothetical protein
MQNVLDDNGKNWPTALLNKENAPDATRSIPSAELQIGCRNHKHVCQTNKITIISSFQL